MVVAAVAFALIGGLQLVPGWPVYYANCSMARLLGAAPIEFGEPGYRLGLDADADGIGCEQHPRR